MVVWKLFFFKSGKFQPFFTWKVLCIGQNHIFQVKFAHPKKLASLHKYGNILLRNTVFCCFEVILFLKGNLQKIFCFQITLSTFGNILQKKKLLLYNTSLNPVPNAQVCVFDGTYYKMMLNDAGVHDIILYWFLFSLFQNL